MAGTATSAKKKSATLAKGQSNLFSFFSKKNPSSSSSSPQLAATSQASDTKSKKSNFGNTDKKNNKSSSSKIISTTSDAKIANKNIETVVVGTRISVFWPDEEEYYIGTISGIVENSQSKFRINYDDGEIETIDLKKEKYKIIDQEKGDEEEKKQEDEPPAKKQKRRHIESDDDEEFEFDDEVSEGDDDDGSEYHQPSQQDDDEDEDDDGQWMVTDDEDDEEIVRKNNKKKRKLSKGGKYKVTEISKPPKNITTTTAIKTPPKSKLSSTSTTVSNTKANATTTNSFAKLRAGGNSSTGSTEVTPTPQDQQKSSNRNNFMATPSLPIPHSRSNSAITQSPTPHSTSVRKTPNGSISIPKPKDGCVNPAGTHWHNHFKFLQNLKDKNGLSQDNPNYNHKTLKVDYREINQHQKKLTPAMEQWWDIKSQYYDTVLLFKTGKFYEMHHMDADVGVNVLGFSYMKGTQAHAGFPEAAYGKFAMQLVNAGYKVARVEQTETPDMFAKRKKAAARHNKPKVMNREICSILTSGTRTYCYLDDDNDLLSEIEGTGASRGRSIGPLLAIRETLLEVEEDQQQQGEIDDSDDQVKPVCEYGITLVDAVRGTVTIGQFADDILRSRMYTLLTTFAPSEILVEAGEIGASSTLLSLIKSFQTQSPSTIVEKVNTKESFPKSYAVDSEIRRKMERKSPTIKPWDVEETLDELHRRGYYPRPSKDEGYNRNNRSTSHWPKFLHAAVEGKADLIMSSFGAVLFYLQRNLIDQEILGMGIVKAYIPPSSTTVEASPDVVRATSTSTGNDGSSQMDVESNVRNSFNNLVTQQQLQEDGLTQDAEQAIATNAVGTTVDSTDEDGINHLALDGTTLQNLEILNNSHTHTASGSLWSKINHTKSPHGSRLLRAWLLRPLFRKGEIDRRADAVEELVSGAAAVGISEARDSLSKCGDIERLLSRVHSMGGKTSPSGGQDDTHPNERAILYENDKHTKRMVSDFSKILNGLRSASEIPEKFQGVDIQSSLLSKIVRTRDEGGCFPNMSEELDWFFDNFDLDRAAKGLFEPARGMDESYDEACDTIERIKRELDEYKAEMCSVLKPSHVAKQKWKYINTKEDSKDKYLIELPVNVQVPDDFLVKGKRGKGDKQVNKYRTPEIEDLIVELERAIDIRKAGKAKGMRLVFSKFDKMRSLWSSAAQATAMLDALGSLAQTATKPGWTRPEILDCPPDKMPCVHVVQGRHPCVDTTHSGGDFIPNDLTLGDDGLLGNDNEDSARVLLLSGPNMGGKSTLLRQTCLITILAQLGSFVPAEEAAITPIDRIYTRLGASDRILLGQSTFFVELAETAAALRGATRRSLVIMDELGRGTSTFDGTAIASATVKHLVERNRCLTLFATHYHSLLNDWKDEPNVRLGHMQCMVDGNNVGGAEEEIDEEAMEVDHKEGSDNSDENNITFLYTLGDGPCPKSFGVNVARLAHLPEEVLSKAKMVSSNFEAEMKVTAGNASQLREEIEGADMNEVLRLWEDLQS